MATTPDHYAALGVSATSDDVVIRAAYKALMLKYHPDTNPSADATRRASAINAAFAILGDPAKRAAYDAARVWQDGSRPSSARPTPPPTSPPGPPPRAASPSSGAGASTPKPGVKRATTWLSGLGSRVAGTIGVALIFGIIRVVATSGFHGHSYAAPPWIDNTTVTDMNSTEGMDTMSDNMEVAANQLDAASDKIASAPTPAATPALGSDAMLAPMVMPTQTALAFDDIEGAARSFDKVLQKTGMAGARAFSKKCHTDLESNPSWPAADRCVAFDYAARFIDHAVAQAGNISDDDYFAFRANGAADTYKRFGVISYYVNDRLTRIRSTVEPVVAHTIDARVHRDDPPPERHPLSLNLENSQAIDQ